MTRSAARIEAPGEAKLRRDLDDAGRDLADLENAHAATARIVLPEIRSRAPRVSGALGSSMRADVTGDGVAFTSPLPYFGPIHNGWPAHGIEPNRFAVDAVLAAESEVVDVYGEDVDRTLAHRFETRY